MDDKFVYDRQWENEHPVPCEYCDENVEKYFEYAGNAKNIDVNLSKYDGKWKLCVEVDENIRPSGSSFKINYCPQCGRTLEGV